MPQTVKISRRHFCVNLYLSKLISEFYPITFPLLLNRRIFFSVAPHLSLEHPARWPNPKIGIIQQGSTLQTQM